MSGWGGALAGAGTGAEIGSFSGPIGTGVGAAIGGVGGWLLGHHSDKPKENPEDQYTAMLKTSAAGNRAEGSALTGMGTSALQPAVEYFRNLLSSNPADQDAATRGDRGRVIDQYDTARRAVATFSPRGGGTTSSLADSRFAQAESIADIGAEARGKAATGAAAIGTSLTGLGLQANQLASHDLDSIINSVLAREGLDVQRHGQNMALWGSLGEAAGTLVGLGMGDDGFGGKGI